MISEVIPKVRCNNNHLPSNALNITRLETLCVWFFYVLVPFMWTVTSDDRGDGNSAIKSHIPITNWYKLLCSSHKFPWYHLITPTYSQCIPLPKQAKPLGTVVVPNSSLALMEVDLNHPISSDFPWNTPSSYWYAPPKIWKSPHTSRFPAFLFQRV